jgi:hypothetical protein
MTESELNELKAQHERWVSDPHTSRGQRTDSQDILKLIAEVERLKEALEFYADWEEKSASAWSKTYERTVLNVEYPGPSKASKALKRKEEK